MNLGLKLQELVIMEVQVGSKTKTKNSSLLFSVTKDKLLFTNIVLWVPVGRWNARYHIERGKQQEVTHYGIHILETALTKMKELNNKQVVAILGIETLTYYKVSHLNSKSL